MIDRRAFAPKVLRFHGLWPVRSKMPKVLRAEGPADRKTSEPRFVGHRYANDLDA